LSDAPRDEVRRIRPQRAHGHIGFALGQVGNALGRYADDVDARMPVPQRRNSRQHKGGRHGVGRGQAYRAGELFVDAGHAALDGVCRLLHRFGRADQRFAGRCEHQCGRRAQEELGR